MTLTSDVHHLNGNHIGCGFEHPTRWDEDLRRVTCKGCRAQTSTADAVTEAFAGAPFGFNAPAPETSLIEVTSEYLREALEAIATASRVPVNAEYGPKPNGVLFAEILLALDNTDGPS